MRSRFSIGIGLSNQNVKVQVGIRFFGDLLHQNVKVQVEWTKKRRKGRNGRFQMYFCILRAILGIYGRIKMYFYILFLIYMSVSVRPLDLPLGIQTRVGCYGFQMRDAFGMGVCDIPFSNKVKLFRTNSLTIRDSR